MADTKMELRFKSDELGEAVEAWRRRQPGRIPTTAAALRTLVSLGLNAVEEKATANQRAR